MPNFIIDHYTPTEESAHHEDNRLDSRAGQVEFLTTCRYIDKYLSPGAKILEIGAASGKYSHHYARRGYIVDAVEPVPFNVTQFDKNTQDGEQVTVTIADARDLSNFADETYDLTLILGPLYHVFTEADKKQVISEALRVTKPGGVLFAAHLTSDSTLFEGGFRSKRFDIPKMLETAYIDPATFSCRSDESTVFELVRKEDIDRLMAGFPVTRLHYVAADLYAHHMRPELEAMDEDLFRLYMQYHFAVCERGDMVGLSHHVLDVFRKN
jgi:SAM-dependent methyltransferase